MFTKKFSKVSAVLLLSALGVAGLASCGKEKEYNVDFMLQENDAWTIFKTEKTVKHTVEAPEAPVKQYYTFGGWYNEETFETSFETTGIKKNSAAFGKYVPEEVKLHFENNEVVTKNLVDIVKDGYTPDVAEGLTFDGWYKDATFSVKWDGKETVSDLYAQQAALITFNNGYEDVYTTLVRRGNALPNPGKTEVTLEDGTVTTLEKNKILREYMDEYDINYADAEGNPFDFEKPIKNNTTITVNWNTVGLRKYIKYWEPTDTYFIQTYSIDDKAANAPVWSMQSTFTEIVEEGPDKTPVEHVRTIEGFNAYGAGWLPTKAKKMIFGEGIKFVAGMNAGAANVIEEISLPSTLKIIDNSFSFMPNLKGVTLPEGLEVLIGSFFKSTEEMTDYYKSMVYGTNYDFDIAIPSTVKNLSMTPTNLTFAEDSKFFKEDGRIYLNSEKGKVLISDADHVRDGYIYVPEGVVGIQTGTYSAGFEYLFLPSTFKFVNYNEDITNYPFYNFKLDSGSALSMSTNHLYYAEKAATPTPTMSPYSYAITCNVGGINIMMLNDGAGFVKFANDKIPEDLPQYAICGDPSSYAATTGSYTDFRDSSLTKYTIVEDKVDTVYASLAYYTVVDWDPETYDPIYKTTTPDAEGAQRTCVSALIPSKTLTLDEIIDAIKLANPDHATRITESLTDRTVKILNNGTEITADKITGEMYLTLEIVY